MRRAKRGAPTGVSRGEDSGFAMVGVIGVMLILSMFMLTTLAFTLQNLKPTRRDQDVKSAVAAAQAGIDDYLARLNSDPNYWEQPPEPTNLAFTTGKMVTNDDNSVASYSYRLLTTPADVAARGVIRLRSVGSLNGVKRTLTATFQPSSFLNYIYHTDKESLPPVLWTKDSGVIGRCSTYWPARNRSECAGGDVQFPVSDVISGPLHSNDALNVGGASPAVTFGDPQTETSYQVAGNRPWRGTATPRGNSPYYAPVVEIPSENSALRQLAADPVRAEGCVYTGATKIVFTGATMSVWSPGTKSAPSRCYNSSTTSTRKTLQTGLAVPAVIYVDDNTEACILGGSKDTGLGYPLSGEYVGEGSTEGTAVWSVDYQGPVYDCKDGTAFVQGTLDGAVTVGTTQDVVIIGNVSYQDRTASSTDVLGLIPGHFAWVYHPIKKVATSTYSNLLTTQPVTTIDAAILAVKDGFIVQNFNEGPPVSTPGSNLLTVTGAIAQKFRGRVAGQPSGAGVTSGYLKNYVYDQRFQRGIQPPYFLKPVSAPWAVRRVSDG